MRSPPPRAAPPQRAVPPNARPAATFEPVEPHGPLYSAATTAGGGGGPQSKQGRAGGAEPCGEARVQVQPPGASVGSPAHHHAAAKMSGTGHPLAAAHARSARARAARSTGFPPQRHSGRPAARGALRHARGGARVGASGRHLSGRRVAGLPRRTRVAGWEGPHGSGLCCSGERRGCWRGRAEPERVQTAAGARTLRGHPAWTPHPRRAPRTRRAGAGTATPRASAAVSCTHQYLGSV